MSFTTPTFLGGVVKTFNASVGLGVGAQSQLSVQLVDDASQSAFFDPPSEGSPVFFQYQGFSFGGIFQRWVENKDTGTGLGYEVTVTDPREILDGAQIITGAYTGSVGGVKNLFNAYGFWESFGYGASQANETGMPWHRVRDAVLLLTNSPSTSVYGGRLTFRGHQYGLDLSELPSTPFYYRVGGGVAIGLLEAIAQVCEDGGYEFFVELVGSTIKVRTISRRNQPTDLSVLSNLVASEYGGRLVRSSAGREVRNEITSSFLVGGEVTTLWMTDALTQFWGYDIAGQPILGELVTETFTIPEHTIRTPDPDTGDDIIESVPAETIQVPNERMLLNATPVADIVGSTSYLCSTLEMRFAQVNMESWQLYMASHRPAVAAFIGITSPFLQGAPGNQAAVRGDFVNDDRGVAALLAQNAIVGDLHSRIVRMYEFVKGIADEYFGRKYLVALPFVLSKTDEETLKVTTSYEIADGGYLPEGSSPLGLSPLNEDLFKLPDGRFKAFGILQMALLEGVDLSKISTAGSIIENNGLYQEIQVDSRMVFNPTPSAVVTLQGPIMEESLDAVGDFEIVRAVLQLPPNKAQEKLKKIPIPIKNAPNVRTPSAFAIPLKSNVLTYGPWFASGASGKVRFEHDPSLTPWNYGSYSLLNLAANSRVAASVTNQQVSETATIELENVPSISLGEVLRSGGPQLTNIDVQVQPGGVTTTYRFQTYTPRFGVLGKATLERLKRQALAGMELRRSLRVALKERAAAFEAVFDAHRTAKSWHASRAKAHKRETPHDCLLSTSAFDGSRIRHSLTTLTMEEAVALSNADDDDLFKNTSVMSLEGVFRPFSTNFELPEDGTVPVMVEPSGVTGLVASQTTLNPWKDLNDVEVWTWGDTYGGLHARRREGDHTNARAIGLRSPLVLVGWGFDRRGHCVPGDESEWEENYLHRQDRWKAGPLDCLWDEPRGVWTVHTRRIGVTDEEIPADYGSGVVTEYVRGVPTGEKYTVWNWASTAVPAGTKINFDYVASDNRLYVVNVDCV